MNPDRFYRTAMRPAMDALPTRFDSTLALTQILAIAFQESNLEHRKQIVSFNPLRYGPASGYYQFESGGGVKGVLRHRATADIARRVCLKIDILPHVRTVHSAIRYNDILATVFARLLLWTLPQALPNGHIDGWNQYLQAWRPGEPHKDTWPENYERACKVIHYNYKQR